MKTDANKGIVNIAYNVLNLPQEIDFGSGNKIRYFYTANGIKQKKVVIENNIITKEMSYIGPFIYDESLNKAYVLFDEGRLMDDEGDYTYEYFLKDHLGNTRVSFTKNGSIQKLQEDHYYPFGMTFQGVNSSVLSPENKYKYNGKELQDDGFDINNDGIVDRKLDLYDYGARYYMLDLGRFTTQDALAEYYYDQSPYNYVANNPISFLDPDGNFRTKFGAWLWKTFNGGGDILQDKGGEYFVRQQVEYTGEGAGIAVKRTFDREGRREGKDLEFEAQKEAFLTQYEFKQTMESMGVEVYYTDDINEARSSMLQIPSMVVIPNVLKSATGVVNTAKQGGKINANSLKELKSLIQKLSKPSSELTKKELHQFTKLVEKYGGKIRKDLNPVKGKIRKPHVQVEGLGKSIENRHIWLKNGVN